MKLQSLITGSASVTRHVLYITCWMADIPKTSACASFNISPL